MTSPARDQRRDRDGRFASTEHADAGQIVPSPTTLGHDPGVRCAVLERADLSVDDAHHLTDPDQPVSVRMAAAHSALPGMGERLAQDPDPFVRYLAKRHSWDLSDDARTALGRDEQVTRIEALLAG